MIMTIWLYHLARTSSSFYYLLLSVLQAVNCRFLSNHANCSRKALFYQSSSPNSNTTNAHLSQQTCCMALQHAKCIVTLLEVTQESNSRAETHSLPETHSPFLLAMTPRSTEISPRSASQCSKPAMVTDAHIHAQQT